MGGQSPEIVRSHNPGLLRQTQHPSLTSASSGRWPRSLIRFCQKSKVCISANKGFLVCPDAPTPFPATASLAPLLSTPVTRPSPPDLAPGLGAGARPPPSPHLAPPSKPEIGNVTQAKLTETKSTSPTYVCLERTGATIPVLSDRAHVEEIAKKQTSCCSECRPPECQISLLPLPAITRRYKWIHRQTVFCK